MDEPITAENAELRRDQQATAQHRACSLYTAIVCNLLRPLDQLDYELLYTEGRIGGRLILGPVDRDIDYAYAYLAAPEGEPIEHGFVARDVEHGGCFQPADPEDPRLENAIAFCLIAGCPHVNA